MIDLAKRVLPWVLALLAVAFGAYLWLGRPKTGGDDDDKDTPAGQRSKDEVRIGTQTSGYSDLLVIAKTRKLFAKEGVKVKLVPMQNGQKAISRVAERDVDLAVVGDIPYAIASFKERRAVLLATIARTSQDVLVFGHREQGVFKGPDLKGKRVGIEDQASAHYALSLFLKRHGLTASDVTVVEIKARELSSAFSRGTVAAIADGFADRHSFVRDLRRTKGPDQIEIVEKAVFPLHLNLATSREYLQQSPDTVKKVLRALIAAAEIVKNNRDDGIAAAVEGRDHDRKKVARDWGRLTFEVTLAPALLGSLEDQAAWYKASGRQGAETTPSYKDLIHTALLRELAPAAVTLPN